MNSSRRSIIVVLSLVIATATIPSSLSAQAVTAAPALGLPLTTRSEGMATGGVADMRDPGNIFRNPAAVAAVNGVYTFGSYKKLVPILAGDVWFGNVNGGGGWTLDTENQVRVALGVTLARLDYGESVATDSQGFPIGVFSSHEDYFALTAGSSATFGRYLFALGAAYKRYSVDFGLPQFAMPANLFDLGMVVSTDVPADDWTLTPALGIAVVNMGNDLEFDDGRSDPLPAWFNYGVSARIEGPTVALGSRDLPVMSATVNVDGSHGLNEQRPEWSFGTEIALVDVVYLRWGREIDDYRRNLVTTWGAGFGVPVGPFCMTLDYAGRAHFNNTDQFGVTVVWNFAEPDAQ